MTDYIKLTHSTFCDPRIMGNIFQNFLISSKVGIYRFFTVKDVKKDEELLLYYHNGKFK